jgi:hypothetical protein
MWQKFRNSITTHEFLAAQVFYLRLPQQQQRPLNSHRKLDTNADRKALQVSANMFKPRVASTPYDRRTVSKVPTTLLYTTVAIIEAVSKLTVDIDVMISGRIEPTKENTAQNPRMVDVAVAEIAIKYSLTMTLDAE